MTKSTAPHVVVVGAGLAGLSCAISCVDSGARVTVLESRPRVGGATWSFERNGLMFDNGQHVYLRCCTAYQRFLERIGTASLAPLQDHLNLPVLKPSLDGGDPRVGWIRSSHLPAPLHLLSSLFSFPYLSTGDRLRLGFAVRALQKLRLDDPTLDDISFGEFLRAHHQSPQAIASLWDLIVLPTVNLRCDQASLLLAAKVFKTGLLEDRSAADIGWSHVPLSELHGIPAVAALERSGAVVKTKAKVTAIDFDGSSTSPSATGVTVDGEHLAADAVVLAVPHEQASELLPEGGTVDPAKLTLLGRSPIIDVHVVYDQKVMDFDVATGIDTPVQYVFDRTDAAGLKGGGQCLAVSISNADDEHGTRPEVLIDRYTAALSDLFPRARTAKIIDAVVSREHAATFRGVPGTKRFRPQSSSGFKNLYLAGAWLDTGWPATMEGAVRSGNAASSNVLAAFSDRHATPVFEEVVA